MTFLRVPVHINLSLSKRIRLLLWFNNPPKQPGRMMSLFCCLAFKHKLCTWWLGQSGDVQHLLHAQFAFGQETDCSAQTSTIPVTFTTLSHSFRTGVSIRVGFTQEHKESEWPQSPSHQLSSSNTTSFTQKCCLSPLYPDIHHGRTNFSADVYNWGERSTHNLWLTQWCLGRLFSVPKPPDSLWWVIYVQELIKKDYHMQMLTNFDYREGKINPRWPLSIF